MLPFWLIGGILLISLGLIGEYIGKIYKEVKRRSLYLIEQELGSAANGIMKAKAATKNNAQDEAEKGSHSAL
ncbi:hypothetical protein GGC63_006166 [Paenibacillus sp. OAS669]|nr:hypothetical protein [Paenibacillus sp. OAS669]